MNKKSLTKNKKKTFKRVAHIYKNGEGLAKWNDASSDAFENATSAENLGSTIGAVGSALGSFVTAGMDNAKLDTTEADNAIESVESYQPDKSSLDALTKSYDNLDFGRTNYEGSEFTVSTGEGLANMGKAALSGASAGATIGGPWGAVAGAAAGLISAGSGWIAGAVNAKSKADELNRKAEMAGYKANSKFLSAKDTIAENATNTLYQGMKSYGGDLNLSGNFDNGLIFVNEGGTHEQNPYDGVLMGVDNQGIPNLVEEGEVIWNDYVFSNRLKPTKKLLTDMGFNEKYKDYTFAKMVEHFQKESEENPNDYISNNTFTEMMNRIMTLQETVRAKKGLKGENRMMALGGRKYSGKEDFDRKSYYGVDPVLAGRTVDISDIVNQANEKLNFYNEPFVPDTFDNLPDVTPTRAMLGKEDIMGIPKVSSKTQTLQSTKSNIGGQSDYGNDALNAKSKAIFDNEIKDRIQENVENASKNSKFDWNTLGQMAPIADNLGKLIYNAAKPVDDSNIIAAKAYREEIPMMNLPEIGGKINYKKTDRNALINPVLNTGRSTINDIKNNAVTGSSAIAGILGATSNTQKAVGNAFLEADARDLNNELQVGNFNFGIDRTNAELARAEQFANRDRGEKIAAARVADATQREALNNLKGKSIDVMSSALAEDVGDLFRQNIQWNWIKDNPANAEAVKALNAKNGGKLLTKKKRRK